MEEKRRERREWGWRGREGGGGEGRGRERKGRESREGGEWNGRRYRCGEGLNRWVGERKFEGEQEDRGRERVCVWEREERKIRRKSRAYCTAPINPTWLRLHLQTRHHWHVKLSHSKQNTIQIYSIFISPCESDEKLFWFFVLMNFNKCPLVHTWEYSMQ